jgi:hypothetical protein
MTGSRRPDGSCRHVLLRRREHTAERYDWHVRAPTGNLARQDGGDRRTIEPADPVGVPGANKPTKYDGDSSCRGVSSPVPCRYCLYSGLISTTIRRQPARRESIEPITAIDEQSAFIYKRLEV